MWVSVCVEGMMYECEGCVHANIKVCTKTYFHKCI